MSAGLAVYWTFDEGQGTDAADGSKNDNDGVLGGGSEEQELAWKVGPTDPSHLVVEIPFPGWSPTVGAKLTPNGPVGVREVLLDVPGQMIVEGVDFGNALVADIDMGDNWIVDEGTAVRLEPAIIDPLDREGDPYEYLWHVISDNGHVLEDGTGRELSFTPHDNGSYIVRLLVTDVDRGLAAYPEEIVVASLNVAPVVDATDAPRAANEGDLVKLTKVERPRSVVTFSDAGTQDTHTGSIDWGDGETSDGVAGPGGVFGSHEYADNGTYTVTVTVTDDDGESGSGTFDRSCSCGAHTRSSHCPVRYRASSGVNG